MLCLSGDAHPALIVETDGYAWHSRPTAFDTDHLRDQTAHHLAHRTLRLLRCQVMAGEAVEIVIPVAARLGIHPCS